MTKNSGALNARAAFSNNVNTLTEARHLAVMVAAEKVDSAPFRTFPAKCVTPRQQL
jgi:hypothetical protein